MRVTAVLVYLLAYFLKLLKVLFLHKQGLAAPQSPAVKTPPRLKEQGIERYAKG